MSSVAHGVMMNTLSAEIKEINRHAYIFIVAVAGFTQQAGQFIRIRYGSYPDRYFSILFRKDPAFDNGSKPFIVALRVSFSEFLSLSHAVIQGILSGKEIFTPQPCSHACWYQSDYGNLLSACGSGYRYIKDISEYITNSYRQPPTLLMWIKETVIAVLISHILITVAGQTRIFGLYLLSHAIPAIKENVTIKSHGISVN